MKSKGLFFLIIALVALSLIILIALLFFTPNDKTKTANSTPAAWLGTNTVQPTVSPAFPTDAPIVPNEFDPVEWTRNPQSLTSATPAPTPSGDFVVTLPGGGTVPQASPGVKFPSVVASDLPNPVSPVAKAPVAKEPVVKAKPTPSPKPVKLVKVKEFWIQVGSFKDRYQAEQVSKSLEGQGLKGNLVTASVGGQTVFRVRVGPYANNAEAQKFLAWVKPVKGLEGSFVTEVWATKPQ